MIKQKTSELIEAMMLVAPHTRRSKKLYPTEELAIAARVTAMSQDS